MEKELYTVFLETLGVPPNLFTADFTVCHRCLANVILYLRPVLCWTSEEGVGFLFLCLFVLSFLWIGIHVYVLYVIAVTVNVTVMMKRDECYWCPFNVLTVCVERFSSFISLRICFCCYRIDVCNSCPDSQLCVKHVILSLFGLLCWGHRWLNYWPTATFRQKPQWKKNFGRRGTYHYFSSTTKPSSFWYCFERNWF